MLNCFSFVHIFFIFIISIIGNVVLWSCDNWSKKSHSLSHKRAVRYKTTHYISVQRYNKSSPRTEWTLKVARLNFQGNFRSTLERCLPTCISFTLNLKQQLTKKGGILRLYTRYSGLFFVLSGIVSTPVLRICNSPL